MVTDWVAELAQHTPSPRWPGQCRCGGKVGKCLMGTLARQHLETEKQPLPNAGRG